MEVRKPFEMKLPQDLLELAKIFDDAGHQLFVVGGAVRDAVMGMVPKDYDVATEATPERVIEILSRPGSPWKVNEVGISFGVVRAHREGFGIIKGYEYEIATFRQDVGEGRRPDSVVFTTIEEDVKRRDLTINALFYDIAEKEIVDLVGGLADIEESVIRTVGDPEDRFREDRLRVLRALRFAARFGWQLEARTWSAVIRDNHLDGVSPERIRDEFVKGVASAQHVRTFLSLLDAFSMWRRIFPGLAVSTSPDVLVSSSGIESREIAVVLAVLLDGNPPAALAKRLNALKYTSQEVVQTTFLMRFRDITESAAFKMKRHAISSGISENLIVEYCGERGMPSINILKAFISYELTVSGDDLLNDGFSGASLGHELEQQETLKFKQLLSEDRPKSLLHLLNKHGKKR